LDRVVIGLSHWALVGMGLAFTLMVSLEVASRYLFGFSTYFVNASARFLILWFFLLGGGIALRVGAHVGFTLLVQSLPATPRRIVTLTMQGLALFFFLQMTWGGLASLGPAMTQVDPALRISLVWAFLAVPVGFGLLAYHMAVLMLIEARPAPDSEVTA
jgi:TRAP-type C4-dicarboxylate transport system permease small subunit